MKLFYAAGACSLAAHIALEEAGANFEPVAVDFSVSQQRSSEYLEMNPKGRVPVLVDNGQVITESPAILRYIARRFPDAGLWPENIIEDARCAEWLSWCVSSVHVAFAHMARPYRYAGSEAAQGDVQAKGRDAARELWEQVEARLARRDTA